jgi:hypothetical protein
VTDRLRAATDRVVNAKEARDYLECPVSEDEREDVLALVRWFRRRYATPVARLAYVRRAYARWRLVRGSVRDPGRRSTTYRETDR